MIKSDMYLLNEQHNVVGIVTGYKEAPHRFTVRTTRGESLTFNTRNGAWEGEVDYPAPYSGNFLGNTTGSVEASSCCGCCSCGTESSDESTPVDEVSDGPILDIAHGQIYASKAGPVLVVENPNGDKRYPWLGFYWTAKSDTTIDLEDAKSYMIKELDSDGRYYDADEEDVFDGLFDLIEHIGNPEDGLDLADWELEAQAVIDLTEE